MHFFFLLQIYVVVTHYYYQVSSFWKNALCMNKEQHPIKQSHKWNLCLEYMWCFCSFFLFNCLWNNYSIKLLLIAQSGHSQKVMQHKVFCFLYSSILSIAFFHVKAEYCMYSETQTKKNLHSARSDVNIHASKMTTSISKRRSQPFLWSHTTEMRLKKVWRPHMDPCNLSPWALPFVELLQRFPSE